MIYLFNQTEELIDVIDEASLIGFTHTIEINQFDRSNFEIPVDYKPDIIKQAQFFGFQSRDRAFCLFKISEKSYNVGLSIEGIDRAESDLHSFIIEDKRPGGTADQVLNVILERTGYQLGDKNGLTITGNLSLYYISARQALVKLIEAFGCEFRTRYTFVENKIIGRYIDLYQRFGKVTGHQFEYGSNILNVTYEEDSDDVVTALIGRGKGEEKTGEDGQATGGYGRRIQFTDVVWSKTNGDPTDKPAGQNYVTNETSKNIYGLHQNGVIKHRFGVYTNENIDNPVELLKATYKELQRVSVPITTFKANLLDLTNEAGQDMWVGDSVAIVRDQIGIAFEARIHKLKIDKLDENRSAVELGDYETLKEKDRSSRQQALNALMGGFNESAIERAIADEAARMDKEFDEKIRVSRLEFDNAVEGIKAKAEENKRTLSDEIDRRFHEFSPAGFEEAKAKAEEALRKAGASSELAEEAKYIADQNSVTFAGLADKVNKQDDKLGDTITDLKRYAREESASQARAVREDVTRDFVGKSTFQENVQGVERRLESLSLGTSGNLLKNSNDGFYNQHDKRYRLVETLQANQTYTLVTKYWHGENSVGHTFFNGIDWVGLNYNQAIDAWMVQFTPRQEIPAGTEIILSSHPYDAKGNMSWATLVRGAIPLIHWQPAKGDIEQKLAEYKETVDGRFATISTQINGKADQSDFQRVKETSQLYERILGGAESDISRNVSRMALTSELFEVEVGKRISNLTNLFYAPTKIPKYISSVATDKHLSRVGWSDHHGIRINYTDSMTGWLGVCFPLTKKFVKQGESFGYRIEIAVDKVPKDGRVLIQLLDNTSNLNMYCNYPIPLTKTGGQVFTGYLDIPSTGELNEYSLRFVLTSPGNIVIHKPMIVDKRIIPNEFIDSTDYNNEYNRTTMSLLQDSFAIKTLTSAGAIASQINTNANNILIEASKIRLKGSTLADEITAIDGRFKRLFVGEGNFATLNTDVLRSNSISGDKLAVDQALINKLVASDVFTNTLSAKNAFINRLRSTIVSATLLEGYKGKIGGFQIGTHEKDPNVYWLTGQNQFDVGMSNGSSRWDQTALWVNWGNNWGAPGDGAWFVKRTGEMYCKNTAHFYSTPIVHGNLRVGGNIYFINDNDKTGGYWIYSPAFKQINKDKGYLYFYDFNNQPTDWVPLNKEISDRRFKTNIKDSQVSGLDVIESLKTYSYRKEYDEKIEDISCGIMAQDVQKYAPEAFYENPDGAYSYNTFALVPYLIKAIQELNKKVERLETT